MSFMDRIRACHVWDRAAYLPFIVGDDAVGLVHDDFAVALSHHGDVFEVDDDGVRLAPGLTSPAARGEAVADVTRRLAAEGWIRGWRDEPYAVLSSDRRRELFRMERAAVPRFGVAAFGVHLNGVVRRDGALLMWIGRRSPHKHTAPLKLDQIVAGGIAAGHGPRETLLKEAAEEAAMPAALAERARPAGIVRYRSEREEGLRNDILYVYDVELPADFVPRNTDGEIIEFFLLPIDEVVARVRDGDEFKFNCALVVIDFLVRQGLIGPEDGDYVDIVAGLHRP
jgi:8-oxo-dGTP pyrophosphatase MutT (NUDIX family)